MTVDVDGDQTRGVGQWITRPALQHVEGRRHVVVLPGVYVAQSGVRYTVPVGAETDGASVPRPLWVLYPPFGDDYQDAAVLHDYLYRHADDRAPDGTYRYPGEDGHLSRAEVDRLMLEVMTVDGFRASGRWVVYRGVRLGGWRAWRRYRRAAAAGAAAGGEAA